MLRFRLLFAALILIPLLGLIIADVQFNGGAPGIWLFPLALVTAVVATHEVLDLLRAGDLRPVVWSTYAGTLLVVLASGAPLLWAVLGKPDSAAGPQLAMGWTLSALAIGIALAFIAEMARYQQPGRAIINVALSIFVMNYVGLMLSFLVALRLWRDNRWGMAALISLIFVVKLSDTGAYICGRLWGRRRLAPRLSPGKTIAGAVGGLLTALAASWLYFGFLLPPIAGVASAPGHWSSWLAYGLILAVAGMVGDLAESLLKRDMGRKDSSSWLWGLGGALDVLDSILLSAAPAYFCWVAGLLGPA